MNTTLYACLQTVGDPDKAVPQALTLPLSVQAEQLTPANFDQAGLPMSAKYALSHRQ